MELVTYTKHYAMCPWCYRDSGQQIDDVMNGKIDGRGTPYQCMLCNMHFTVVPSGEGLSVQRQEIVRPPRSISLLRVAPRSSSIFLIVWNHIRSEDDPDAAKDDDTYYRSFFGEYACPKDVFKSCIEVIHEGEPDPHGIAEFVRCLYVPDSLDDNSSGKWPMMFPEAFSDG